MLHSIICWDCSFRNFFHTIDSLLNQRFNRNNFEIIYIEQRSKEYADAFNRRLNLRTLWNRYQEVKESINIRVIYLNEPPSVPYHLGRIVNVGIKEAKGEIISVMDGDLLVPEDFLEKLTNYHDKYKSAVINLFRHMADRPVGVNKKNWINAEIDFENCLSMCPTRNDQIPQKVSNKGPLISARRENWMAVEGYDEHLIWSTGLSRLGQDVNLRLELFTGFESVALPDSFAVHPWHEQGFIRTTINSKRILDLQNQLINWSLQNEISSWKSRLSYTNQLFKDNQSFIEKMIFSDLMNPGSKNSSPDNVFGRFLLFVKNSF